MVGVDSIWPSLLKTTMRTKTKIPHTVNEGGHWIARYFGVDQETGKRRKMTYPSPNAFRFSGAKIYPGKGIRFVRADSQVFLFSNSKCKRYFHNRLKPSKLKWTAMYRKQHKKLSAICDIAQEAVKKRRRAIKKLEIKERIKKTKDEKKAKKAVAAAKQQETQSKGNIPKGSAPKGPKLRGGGGKR
ncbi:60S ribosomal protein L24 [Hibiscus syriacus]|uniref:60S ribosomal protein L24 n=1 Tax=Hibiscus syriacus TaxID=106335 RepID=A0A6A2XN79_HIBSY|nr:60S ribosomal protein L24 [Hibiscus syriacus]